MPNADVRHLYWQTDCFAQTLTTTVTLDTSIITSKFRVPKPITAFSTTAYLALVAKWCPRTRGKQAAVMFLITTTKTLHSNKWSVSENKPGDILILAHSARAQ
jgi:hypothetical protein